MTCPGCGEPMATHVLAAHMGASVTVDLCTACQAFWFDGYESLQLTPAATLRLFQIVGDAASATRRGLPPFAACPRCSLRLQPATDMQRNTRFRYGRCPRGHGRFITFFDFLKEKNFVRTLSASQLAKLRVHVQTVNCSNCGAPIDLHTGSACEHCGSLLSMFDLPQAQALIEQLRAASHDTPAANASLPLDLLRARRDAERAFSDSEIDDLWFRDAASVGTVAAGMMAFGRWLGQKL